MSHLVQDIKDGTQVRRGPGLQSSESGETDRSREDTTHLSNTICTKCENKNLR